MDVFKLIIKPFIFVYLFGIKLSSVLLLQATQLINIPSLDMFNLFVPNELDKIIDFFFLISHLLFI